MNALSTTLPSIERIVGLWKAACEARQSRVSELEGILSRVTSQHASWREETEGELEAKQVIEELIVNNILKKTGVHDLQGNKQELAL